MRACLEALLLISRRPARSPLLKLPLPCLNSHSVESGDPVWKTSLTGRKLQHASCSEIGNGFITFVKTIHIQLANEGRDVGVFKILAAPN